MIRRVRRALRLSAVEWRAFLMAALGLAAARAALRLLGFRRAHALFTGAAAWARAHRAAGEAESFERVGQALARATRCSVLRATCLPLALAAHLLLGLAGVGSALKIGARRAGCALEGHAWVESAHGVLDLAPPGAGPYTVVLTSVAATGSGGDQP